MKFLTDENLSKDTLWSLRSAGFQVKDVKEENLEGSKDLFLANFANKENLVIITLDSDFAKLFKEGVIKTGVILIAHKRHKTKQITKRLLEFLENKSEKDILSSLSIVD